jgi:hypothetical protein
VPINGSYKRAQLRVLEGETSFLSDSERPLLLRNGSSPNNGAIFTDRPARVSTFAKDARTFLRLRDEVLHAQL